MTKKRLLGVALAASLMGFVLGRATAQAILESEPESAPSAPQEMQGASGVQRGHFDFSLVASAAAQEKAEREVRPFGFNSRRDPGLAPDAPPITYWNIDDIRKAHTELAERAAKALTQAGTGSSQSFGGGPVHVQTRNFSIFMLYRAHREQPVMSLTKVSSVWDDAEMHAGAYDFYVFTGGTGEMVLGGKIANQQNLRDSDGIIPGEYRGQPIEGGQTYKVKAGDWLLIPPDTPHQPKPDPGGFSYMIMKINVGIYPWALIR